MNAVKSLSLSTFVPTVIVASLLLAESSADTVFLDDFSDGDPFDGNPVTWVIADNDPDDNCEIIDGILRLTSGGNNGGQVYAG